MFFIFHPTFIFCLEHEPTPKEAALELVQRWNDVRRPHLVLDAAFGSLSLGSTLTELGFLWSMGANRGTQLPWIWPCMENNLCKGEGRVMMNKDGVIANLFLDNKAHTLFTNSWQLTGVEEVMSEGEHSESKEESSDKTDVRSEGEVQRGKEKDLRSEEWEVTSIDERKVRNHRVLYKTCWSGDVYTWEPFGSFVDLDRISAIFLTFSDANDWRNGFKGFNTDKLKAMCNSVGISRSMSIFFTFFCTGTFFF